MEKCECGYKVFHWNEVKHMEIDYRGQTLKVYDVQVDICCKCKKVYTTKNGEAKITAAKFKKAEKIINDLENRLRSIKTLSEVV